VNSKAQGSALTGGARERDRGREREREKRRGRGRQRGREREKEEKEEEESQRGVRVWHNIRESIGLHMQKCEEEEEDEGFGREGGKDGWEEEEKFVRMHRGRRNGGIDGMEKIKCVWTEPHVLHFHLHDG